MPATANQACCRFEIHRALEAEEGGYPRRGVITWTGDAAASECSVFPASPYPGLIRRMPRQPRTHSPNSSATSWWEVAMILAAMAGLSTGSTEPQPHPTACRPAANCCPIVVS